MTALRGRIGSYGWWQLRDYAASPMIWTILAGLVFGAFPMIMLKIHAGSTPADQVPYARTFDAYVAVLGFAAPMLAVVRMVSGDRAPGLTRFVFSKPIGVRRYYAQMWLLRLIVGFVVVGLGALAISTFIATVPWLDAIGAIGISFVLIGGVGFLLSVLTKMDGGLLIAVYMLPDLLSQVAGARPDWPVVKPLLKIMPPMHRLDEIRTALMTDAVFPRNDAIHALLYGVGCFVLGVYLVRKMPLVR